ncbi:MAG: PhoH family protein [Mariprofundaceae bacterium]|nr:PhoH family protein [Mariprofundaceae bacterium]
MTDNCPEACVHLNVSDAGPQVLRSLCGSGDRILHRIETRFGVHFLGQPGDWQIEGSQARMAAEVVYALLPWAKKGPVEDVQLEGILRTQAASGTGKKETTETDTDAGVVVAGRRRVQGKTPNQRRYLDSIRQHVLTLAVGPAGTGKTYLAVALAVEALQSHQVERIILTRPAVEAGERLGFLPGDIQQKVDPYLRPLFDALADMIGLEKMNGLMESGRIEVAPLAYMRGRTLNDAFVILDEAQNTTREQMKMFLTRLGFSSKMVVTGDTTQVDLPAKHHSGLLHVLQVLEGVETVGICRLIGQDVVRHPLVEKIVAAYERSEAGENDR